MSVLKLDDLINTEKAQVELNHKLYDINDSLQSMVAFTKWVETNDIKNATALTPEQIKEVLTITIRDSKEFIAYLSTLSEINQTIIVNHVIQLWLKTMNLDTNVTGGEATKK